MIIRGKEYKMAYTVGAMGMMDALFEDARCNDLAEYLSFPRSGENAIRTIKCAIALNRGYIMLAKLDDPLSEPNELTFDLLSTLKQGEFSKLVDEIIRVVSDDSKPDVELETVGGPKAPAGGEE